MKGSRKKYTGEEFALVDFRIRVAELDGDVALELLAKSHSLHAADRFHKRRFTVRDVTNRS